MKKFKICLLLVGATYAQTGCSPLDVCPDMGDDFSCGVLLTTYPDPEVSTDLDIVINYCLSSSNKRPGVWDVWTSEYGPELYEMWLYDNIDVQIRGCIEQV